MEKALSKGTKCHVCGHEFENGDTNVYYFKEEDLYRCEKCAHKHFKTEVYSRVVGYLRPVDNWNVGKKEEYKDRKEFIVK